MYIGEIISLVVALSWTLTAMAADVATRYASSLTVNVVRMVMSLVMFVILLFVTTGSAVPMYADSAAWFWLSMSGLIGYVFGDLCLFRGYQLMGARYGQLLMTLAPLFSALGGWMVFDEGLSAKAFWAMLLVLSGIAMSVFGRSSGDKSLKLKISGKAILIGIGAAMGQGFGLVLSKLGMLFYEASLPPGVDESAVMMPFAATAIRCLTGLVGFGLIMLIKGETRDVGLLVRNGRAMTALTIATIFGPVVGVSLSLLAVMYTSTGIAATLMALVPIFILLPSWLVMHQRITVLDVIGSIIAVAGVALLFL